MVDKVNPIRKRLSENPSNISDIFEYAFECISRIDRQGNYLRVSERYADTCGYLPEEMVGLSWHETIHIDDIEKAEDAYDLMLEMGRAETELRGIRKKGTTFYKRIVLVKGIDDENSLLSHYCFMQDITEQKLSEQHQLSIAIKDAKNKDEKLNNLVSMLPSVVFRSDSGRKKIIEISNKVSMLTGYSSDEIVNKINFNDLIHEDDYKNVSIKIEQAIESKKPYTISYRIHNKSGEAVKIIEQGVPVIDSDNKTEWIDGLFTETESTDQYTKLHDHTADSYFKEAAKKLSEEAGVKTASIAECVDFTETSVRPLAFYHNEHYIDPIAYKVVDTPCEKIIQGESFFYPKNVQKLFPNDLELNKLNAESYSGVPLINSFQEVIGHIFIMDDKPLENKKECLSLLDSFAKPVAKELESYQSDVIFNDLVDAFNVRQGKDFFNYLATYVQKILKADYVVIGELINTSPCTINTLVVCHQGKFLENLNYPLNGSPCEVVLNNSTQSYPRNIQNVYPESKLLKEINAESYVASPLCNAQGKAIGVMSIINTAPIKNIKTCEALVKLFSVRAASELNRVQREKVLNIYEGMINASNDLISIVDLDYKYLFVNKAYLDFYQKAESEIVEHTVLELHGKNDFTKFIKPNLDKCFQGENIAYEIVKVAADNSENYLHAVYTPYYSNHGEVLGAVVTSRDLTTHVNTERELGRSREYLKKIIKVSPDVICVTDLDEGEIVEVNQGFCEATGWSREEAIGKTTLELELYSAEFRKELVKSIVDNSGINNQEVIINKKNGEPAYLLASCFFIDLFGENRILSIAKDITERKQAEILLEFESKCYQIDSNTDNFNQTLEKIIKEVESNFDSLIGSICMLDREGKRLKNTVSPGLAKEYCDAIDGIEIGEGVGSCGTAAYREELVVVSDIQTDELWQEYRDLAERFQLKACWSIPIKSSRQEVIGTFAGYYKHAQSPSSFELMLLYRVARIVGAIVEQKINDEELRESREKFRTLYDDTPSMFFNLNEAGTIISVNEFGARHLGYEVDQLVGNNVLYLVCEDDRKKASEKIKECFANPGAMYRWELRKECNDGRVIWVRETAHVLDTRNKQEVFIICEDISENYRLSQQLEYQATHDALTTLVNRSEFEKRLERVLDQKSMRIPGHAICYLDLDNFKIINDTCGHLAGDAMLKQLSELLAVSVRGRDTLARLGGDEFGILMENCSLKQAYSVAEKILSVVEDFRFVWNENKFTVGVSIGLVPIDETSGNVTDVLSEADNACYYAKDSGRNRIHVFAPDDDELEKRRGEMQWVARINQALEEKLFCLFYQDVIPSNPHDRNSNKRFELLVRIKTHDGGYILPGAFLPAAERYNLSTKIDQWVIKSALGWLSADRAVLNTIESCAINISGHSLGNENFLGFCIEQLNKSKVPANKLCFEITETAAIANLSSARHFMSELKNKGCSFALDDFGSGLSSFGYLKNLPVEYIKIDGAFIRDLIVDPVDFEMVTAINRLGHVMDKKTIAEFVENDEILNMLNDIGVDYAQGYGISQPKPIEMFPSK